MLFVPEPTPEDDWVCKYILKFPEKSIEGTLIGIDGFQALLLAMKTAKTLLINYFLWLGMDGASD